MDTDREARADCQCGELIDRIAANAPVRELLCRGAWACAAAIAGYWSDHQGQVQDTCKKWSQASIWSFQCQGPRLQPEKQGNAGPALHAIPPIAGIGNGFARDVIASPASSNAVA